MQQFNPDSRKYLIIGGICAIIFIYLVQLFYIQVIKDDYKIMADNNAFLKKTLYPSRGMLYDRNGKLLVFNQPAYDLTIVMKEVRPFDTLKFCNIVNISKEYLIKCLEDIKNRRINPGYSPYLPQTILTQLGEKEFGILQEFLYKFPGFYIQSQPVRKYNYPHAAHLLGYMQIVDRQNIFDDNYYSMRDYIGKSGVERSYESVLRGEKGVEVLLRDSHGRIKGKYENGIYDRKPVSGKDLILSIDIELQKYGEELMQNKMGTIVMIEPSTGEILCMVIKPDYDPALFVGRQFRENYTHLLNNPEKPLFNRALSAMYPPGSTFKAAQGLVFLEENIITPQTMFTCYHGFPLGNGRLRCHGHESPLSLSPAIGTSCNSYFCWGIKSMLENKKYGGTGNAINRWHDCMVNLGLGRKLGIDLPGEKGGFIPNAQYYNKKYKNRWNAFTVISIAIGQGEVLTTPVQICNMASQIANRGYFYTPHVVKNIKNGELDTTYTKRHYTGVSRLMYDPVIDGLRLAVTNGTCWGAWIPDIEVCGKTGTAQNPDKDHSIFMGFAPKDNPQVAIAVYVENGGYGSEFAVPIGRLMIEKYLRGGSIAEYSKWFEYNVKNNIPAGRRNAIQED
ncbi:MAG: penicillin-binding protein 2 [Dysgonamonadaceae bacterium]|jgi:penicillin-binding protein 2|nr:penicillin-binding protein 2 [Dysgonamonadaceae bacterium]